MSRANPIALRIASKTQTSMFIGVSQYYFYNHLKQNLNILKLTGLISKQIVLPTNKLVKYKANSDNLTVLTPHLLPINTTCGAKQLFSIKYRLNKRRFSSAILHYVRWLQDDFNINYKRFSTGTGSNLKLLPYKFENLSIAPIYLNGSRQSKVKKNYTQFCHITKANQISDIFKYFVFNRSYNNSLPYPLAFARAKAGDNFINCLIRLSSLALKGGIRPFGFSKVKITKKPKIDMQTKEISLFYSKLLYMQNFKKMQIVMEDSLSLPINSNAPKDYPYSPVPFLFQKLEKIHKLCCFRPNYKDITNNMLLLAFLNLLYSQNKTICNSLLKGTSLTNQLSARQQKSFLYTEKSTQFTNLNNYLDSTAHNDLSTKYSYVLSPYSGLKKPNNLLPPLSPLREQRSGQKQRSNFSKVQKHINFFSNTAKSVIPLELIIYRSFCEPAGLNYFTALENRLSKSRLNINFSNALFRRISNNGFIPNYTNTQTGLIRLRAQIIFEFLYTLNNQGKSVIEQNNFFLNHRHMSDSENIKLWLRKGSSIRL
uniref:hypothetical protein n=1 Tax=Ulva meridionalis TaxID=434723 RepID=UPI002115C350|nr:hypothetical protein NQY40_mgp58 [Ulva meridionalis]UTA96498.1 hypothetical protein [Ulva meridionalis]UTA96558.1 hypothetical protein [Ulva meridionalis]UTA96615.1 hypothetical protein [Ulva meridionalis]UTA96667.1 hypothetical protein [Ulva meridionalis]UTA96720.1 hypothetical protein [Ulva meridionalis]